MTSTDIVKNILEPTHITMYMPATVAVTKKSVPTKIQATPKARVTTKKVAAVTKKATDDSKVQLKTKKKRQRPFAELYAQISEDITTAYKALQAATKALKSLESAHNREVGTSRSRANTQRTPTIVFSQALVDYFTSRLDASELKVKRKDQNGNPVVVDLSDMSTEKRVHRTDVTQLYNKTFVKHDLRNSEDRRYILYQNDPELVALLTEGYKTELTAERKAEIQQILDGTYKLNIFNIQRFTSQHLNKVTLPSKE